MKQESSRGHSSLKLGAELERRAEELGRMNGLSAADIVREALDEYASRHGNGTKAAGADTLYDRAQRAKLIGCLKGAPSDLSTNPKYMEGFGRE